MLRSLMPMISAAAHQVIFFAIAFNYTPCSFISRSTPKRNTSDWGSLPSLAPSAPFLQSGQIAC
jgi:hypothetical protein